jgi:hypothetical protein
LAEPVLIPGSDSKMIVNGLPELDFYIWMEAITTAVNNLQPLTGTGTPESSIVASAGRWYVDTSAGVGSGIYFKETGDGDTGWVLRS